MSGEDETEIVISLPGLDKYGVLSQINNDNKISSIRDAIKLIVSSSQKIIRICSPFMDMKGFFEINSEISSKIMTGTKVKILSRELEQTASRRLELEKIYHELMKVGNKNWEIRDYHFEDKNGRLTSGIHAKIVTCDEKLGYIGSGEIRKNSFKNNFEMGMLIREKKKIMQINKIFDFMFEISEPFNIE